MSAPAQKPQAAPMLLHVIHDYDPECMVSVRADDPVTKIPFVTELAARLLFANAYVRTVADAAALPERYPGIACAFAQDKNFCTWQHILDFARRVVESPEGAVASIAAPQPQPQP